jgi:predicted nucleotidyltransferase
MAENEILSTAREYAAAVRDIIDAKAIFLYGSHAKGTATKDSDIDIAVVVDEVNGDYLTLVSKLWSLTRKISHDIEPVLLTNDDRRSGFLQTVEKTGIAV